MISTITVNYKTADYLERMLESLFAHHTEGGLEVIVVENASGDDLSVIEERFSNVKLIRSETNRGFAGGCNLGIASAHGDFVVLLNPDIVFTEPALYRIRDAMQADPSVGIGGIALKNMDETQQKCVWRFPTPLDQLLLLFKVHHVAPRTQPIRRWRMDDFDYSHSTDVDQVMGAFFCMRREVIDHIGALDDGFFMWYEEVDYCKRAKEAGWRIRYFSPISAKHKKGSSFDRVPTLKKQAMLRKSIRRYMRKHFGPVIGLLFWLLEPVFYVFSILASILKPI